MNIYIPLVQVQHQSRVLEQREYRAPQYTDFILLSLSTAAHALQGIQYSTLNRDVDPDFKKYVQSDLKIKSFFLLLTIKDVLKIL